MGSFLKRKIDFERHNAECRKVWAAYNQRKPSRVPITVAGSIRNFFQNPELNTTGYAFEDFFKNPQAQIECQLAYQKWCRYNLVCDTEMGPPKNGWEVGVNFQNSWEAGWMGCPLHYFGNDMPDTSEILKEDKSTLYQLKEPDALHGGLLGRAMEFFDYMHAKCPQMEFEGLPVRPPASIPGEGTDGPFDLAYKLRGAAEVCLDMYEDPKYYHDLMSFITENIIRRIKAIRQWRWARNPDAPDKGKFKGTWGFADDAIAMISTRDYEQFVFPYHKRLVEEFSDGSPVSIHLCGDATRHFKFLRDRLNVQTFDTGFPVDFAWLRQELGPDVQINGGPTIMLLKDGKPEQIRKEVKRICASGIMKGGRFVLREANNMAPCTPIENVEAMYAAGKEYGRY
ncbi:MAG: uroporphyrinogen decarboxylase family protein [Kiritimatiellota bacterium]|nr:uroporphyrinogen decarboxylase family protein [Kiritimatiellota bacterium]